MKRKLYLHRYFKIIFRETWRENCIYTNISESSSEKHEEKIVFTPIFQNHLQRNTKRKLYLHRYFRITFRETWRENCIYTDISKSSLEKIVFTQIFCDVLRRTGVLEGASSNPARVNSFSVDVSSVRKSWNFLMLQWYLAHILFNN